MSDNARDSGQQRSAHPEYPVEPGFDATMAGKIAECDGGQAVPGTHMATRQDFTGTLSGDYIDHGVPAWRWYLMVNLTHKPDGYEHDAVWCESGSVFLKDGTEPNQPGRRR